MKKPLGKKSRTPANDDTATSASINAGGPPANSVKPAGSALSAAESPAASSERVVVNNSAVLGARITWFFVGPFILFLILINIVRAGTGWLTALDAAYFVVLAAMIFCRWYEQRSGQGTTTTGEPATWEDFRRYALVLPPLAIGAWILANAIGNHML